jgi:hypothetical protein
MKAIRYGTIGLGIIVVALSFLATAAQSAPLVATSEQEPAIVLETQKDKQNKVTVKVQPQEFRFNEPVRFKVTFDTHSADLGFKLTEIAALVDDTGNVMKPLNWDGSPPGGHHRSGTLTFPGINSNATSLKLIFENVAGVPQRTFIWSLTNK